MSAACKLLGPALRAWTLALAALICASTVRAAPQVRIDDAGGGRLKVEAHDASVREVLDTLKGSHLIQFRASDGLSRAVTGTYTGTLPQVLSRILDGYNYFLQVTPSGTQLHILDIAPSNAVTSSAVPTVPIVRRATSTNVDTDIEKVGAAAAPDPAGMAPHRLRHDD